MRFFPPSLLGGYRRHPQEIASPGRCIYMVTHEMCLPLAMGQGKEVACNWDIQRVFFNIGRKI